MNYLTFSPSLILLDNISYQILHTLQYITYLCQKLHNMYILDSRDLITLREELKDALLEQYNEHNTPVDFYEDMDMEWFWDENDILVHIKEIDALEAELHSEWEYGITFINEDYFTDYCEELCKDLGYISNDLPGFIEIDWNNTANNIRVDYNAVNYRGETYLCRL